MQNQRHILMLETLLDAPDAAAFYLIIALVCGLIGGSALLLKAAQSAGRRGAVACP